MKVALLSDCYLPRLGGIEVQVHDLGQRLAAAGHQVEVFTATPGPAGQHSGATRADGPVTVHHFSHPVTLGVPVNPLARGPVRRRLATGGFDAAHVHMGVVSPFAMDAAHAALQVGLPTAITWHCVLDRSRRLMHALGYARRWAGQGAALSAVSAMAAERVAGISESHVNVLNNGIDAEQWLGAPGAHGARADEAPVRIVTAMRLVRRKRPGAFVDVLAAVRSQLPESITLQADIFGDGPARAALVKRIEAAGLSSWVHLRGRVERSVLQQAYADSDIYVSAAALEAFGIAALEARAAGVPVVARAGTGVEDFVVDGLNGLLGHDDADLAAAVSRLAADRTMRAEMFQYNRIHRPRQDWPTVLAATLAEYARAGAES